MPAAPAEVRRITQIYVLVEGTQVEDGLRDDLRYCHVESTVHLPDLATLCFNNSEFEWLDRDKFRVGQKLEIEMGDSDLKRSVFKGEITSIETEIDLDGAYALIVRAYDKAHRLHRGRYTRTFLNVTDSDIVKDIGGELAFDVEAEATREVHDYVIQHNQTNWEFLQERAARLGFELQVSDNKLVFKPPPSTPAEELTLTMMDQLLSFRARVTTGEQVNEVEVRGWDPQQKRAITGKATRPKFLPEIGIRQTGGEFAESAFKRDAKSVVAQEPVYSQEQADSLAQAVLDDLSSPYITAEGVALGDPRLRLGSKLTIEKVGTQFSGKYVVTQVRHRYEQDYHIDFEVAGRRSTEIGSIFAPPSDPRLHTLIGIVTNNKDPDNLARVKVKFPTLPTDPGGNEPESFWLRVVSPYAGKDRGFQFTPEIDDEVLVMGWDMNQPFVLGALWNGMDEPPLASNDAVDKRIIKSRSGHFLLFDDSNGGTAIEIVDSSGGNKIVIETTTKKVTITADGDIAIKAGANLELSAAQSIKLDANVQLDLQGNAGVAVQSNARVAVSAPQVSLG